MVIINNKNDFIIIIYNNYSVIFCFHISPVLVQHWKCWMKDLTLNVNSKLPSLTSFVLNTISNYNILKCIIMVFLYLNGKIYMYLNNKNEK